MMTMRYLARRLPELDAPVKFAVALAVILLILLLVLGFGGPQAIQTPARFGAFGLLVSLQVLFLWANRRDISPYHQAQKKFIDGDFRSARSILENHTRVLARFSGCAGVARHLLPAFAALRQKPSGAWPSAATQAQSRSCAIQRGEA